MALKSSREGLRKELVDYLGNIIIDENLKQNIINSVDDVFINNEELMTSVNELDEKIRNETSARENADNTLQENINSESTARQEAVTNIENLINNGVLKVDLLWTNANPTSEFAEQNIFIDLSNYKVVVVEVCEYGGTLGRSQDLFSGVFLKGVAGSIITLFKNENKYFISFMRKIYAIDDRVYISNASDLNSTNNIGAIPQRIWGLS